MQLKPEVAILLANLLGPLLIAAVLWLVFNVEPPAGLPECGWAPYRWPC